MILPPRIRRYLILSLLNAPDVLELLLRDLGPDDPRWDVRPDPERFSLREILAHLVKVEAVWTGRATRTRDEERPFFPAVAGGGPEPVVADTASPHENLHAFRTARQTLVDLLEGLDDAGWERVAESEMLGSMTIEQQAVFLNVHDGYHARQVMEWLQKGD